MGNALSAPDPSGRHSNGPAHDWSEIHATTKLFNAQHLTHLQLTGNLVWLMFGASRFYFLVDFVADSSPGCWLLVAPHVPKVWEHFGHAAADTRTICPYCFGCTVHCLTCFAKDSLCHSIAGIFVSLGKMLNLACCTTSHTTLAAPGPTAIVAASQYCVHTNLWLYARTPTAI